MKTSVYIFHVAHGRQRRPKRNPNAPAAPRLVVYATAALRSFARANSASGTAAAAPQLGKRRSTRLCERWRAAPVEQDKQLLAVCVRVCVCVRAHMVRAFMAMRLCMRGVYVCANSDMSPMWGYVGVWGAEPYLALRWCSLCRSQLASGCRRKPTFRTATQGRGRGGAGAGADEGAQRCRWR